MIRSMLMGLDGEVSSKRTITFIAFLCVVIAFMTNVFMQIHLEEHIFDYFKNWSNVKVLSTGEETNTGGRLFKVREYLDENFIITYGDGLANVNIKNLIKFHLEHQLVGTITVTNPTSRFGLVEFDKDLNVEKFIEKPKLSGFVNIGFMAFKKSFLKYLDDDSTLELEPIINLTKSS